jgi:purine-cytosine permease-like protein
MQAVIGALVFAMTGFGLGWVNSGADYSRYLPRSASSRGVVGWTTFGASVAPVVLVIWGLLLAGSDKKLADAISADPIGALTTLLPHATLWLFLIVVLLGLAGGAVLDIYSSGLALLSVGLKIPRWSAAGIDAIIMSLGAIYLLWIAKQDFFYTFQGFLITLGVPIAAWCGIFLGDMALRKAAMAEDELYQPSGRYRSLNPVALILIVVCTALGWGLVISSTTGLTWQGYLLDPLGLRANWAYANLGVLLALALGFFGQYLLGRSRVRAQESIPIPAVQSLV